jgi:hypothetical protein
MRSGKCGGTFCEDIVFGVGKWSTVVILAPDGVVAQHQER